MITPQPLELVFGEPYGATLPLSLEFGDAVEELVEVIMQSLRQPTKVGFETLAYAPSSDIYSGVLAASTEQTVEVPAGASIVIFSHDDDIWVNWDTTAALPTGAISEAGGEMNPVVRSVNNVSAIHLIAERETKVSLSFYAI
jgi:hypothetical protein